MQDNERRDQDKSGLRPVAYSYIKATDLPRLTRSTCAIRANWSFFEGGG